MNAKVRSASILFILCALSVPAAMAGEYAPVVLPGTSTGIRIEILPEIELLSGVLTQTSWERHLGMQGKGNAYYRELKAFFGPYRRHRAIKIADRLTRRGFTYDAPPHLIASLGPLPDLAPSNGYDQYVIDRARGLKNVRQFRDGLVDLAKESGFAEFFKSHRDAYEGWLRETTEGLDTRLLADWLAGFFGWHGQDLRLILAPGLLPDGGYGATIRNADGSETIYQFIRENGRTEGGPEFPRGIPLQLLSLHEWGHAYVAVAFAKHKQQFAALDSFFEPVAAIMKRHAYPSWETFFNEQLVRAITTFAMSELQGPQASQSALSWEEKNGFYLTSFTVEQLKHYRTHRDDYKRFDDFIPYLIEQYSQNREKLRQRVAQVRIAPLEAGTHIGEELTVCGTVASVNHESRRTGVTAYLNLDTKFPGPSFRIAITTMSRGHSDGIESENLGKHVCVSGTIKKRKGVPEIEAREPSQIRAQE